MGDKKEARVGRMRRTLRTKMRWRETKRNRCQVPRGKLQAVLFGLIEINEFPAI